MIEKARLSVADIREMSIGDTKVWHVESGAAILSARNILAYVQRHDGYKYTSKADFVNNRIEITRLS